MCEVDFDCPGALVCYTNLTWQEPGESICDCSNWYGWEGQDCTTLSIQGIIYLGFASVLAFSNGLPFLVFVFDMRHFVRVAAARDSNNTTLTLLYSAVGLLGMALYGGFLIGSLESPKQHITRLPNSDEKFSRFGQAERVVSILAVGFTAVASLNVSLMWIEVADRIRKYNRDQKKHVYTYRHLIRLVQICFAGATILSIILGSFIILFGLSIPLDIILLVSYICGRMRFATVLHKANLGAGGSKNSEYAIIANRVKRTSTVVILSIIVWVLAIGVFSILISFDWKEYGGEVGTVNPVVLGLNVAMIAVTVWNNAVFWYARATFLNFLSGKSSSSKSRKGSATAGLNRESRGSYSGPSFASKNVQSSFALKNPGSFGASDQTSSGIIQDSAENISTMKNVKVEKPEQAAKAGKGAKKDMPSI